ncbi:MAG: hypothetical protein KAH54_01665 [Candidatus Sabulitectum sp.]|nr:hypothetical protein [Candidatus Sabulitectum sp.]
MRFVSPVWILFTLVLISCGENRSSVEQAEDTVSPQGSLIHQGSWSVLYDDQDSASMRVELVIEDIAEVSERNEVDSLNFSGSLPDSLRFNMEWRLGASSALIFSVTISDSGEELLRRSARTVCETAVAVRPEGLRSVYLSDRTGSVIDEDRASTAVEPPPRVSHHLLVYYRQDSTSTSLEVIDSLVVDFRESAADSMAFTYIYRDGSSVISSTAGIFRRGSDPDLYHCFADSSGVYTGVFRNQFRTNIPYLDSRGRVSVQSRLTSAYLSGDAYYPISSEPENYAVRIFLPDSISSWTPLERGEFPDEWHSGPGGIAGGLPMAIGNYTESTLFPRYRMLVLEGSPISSLDSIAVSKMASLLRSSLDFPSAEFSFVEIINPDGPVVISAFGGMLFSRGSLESLADVSTWDEDLTSGIVPPGSGILIDAAKGILLQSLQLDPILSDVIAAWTPLRYYSENVDDEVGTAAVRRSYMKYYLFNTETLGGNGSTPVVAEFALGDPMLDASPLRPFVVGGKGVIVMEYLHSLRMLNRLPYLLQDFTHASSGNFWLKISSSLRVYHNTDKYNLLRALLYQPGIPQIHARWWEEDEKILIKMVEIQPGLQFDLEFSHCQLILSDTTIVRTLMPSMEPGLIQCTAGLPGYVAVDAIDLNHSGLIPVDVMYTRVSSGNIE